MSPPDGPPQSALATQAEVELARRQLSSILGEIDAIAWEADVTRRRFSFVSKRAENMLGYPPSAWLEEDELWRRIVEPEDRALAELYFQEAAACGIDHEHEYRVRSADGRVVWVRDRVRVVSDRDGEPRLHGVTVDLTARRKLQDRLVQAQKMDAVGQLAGGVAHDFNSLLGIVSGCVDLLLARTTDETSLSELREIDRAVSQAGELVAQLLAFGRRAARHAEIGRDTTLSPFPSAATPADDPDERAEGVEQALVVLVVEEDPATRELMRSTLEREGHLVHEAAGGNEALEFLEHDSARVDLLLSDLAMPEVSGPELLAGLAPLGHSTRALFVSTHADSRLLPRGLNESPVGVLRKPFTPAELATRVAALMDQGPPPVSA